VTKNVVNQKQTEYWNGEAGSEWVAKQEKIDKEIGPLGLAMLDRAEIIAGERVLDAGCGCGGTTLEIARRIGSVGHVTGVDLSAPMLTHAGKRAQEAGLDNMRFIQADTQTHDFGSFKCDLLTSRFGVMFFEDPTAAFANLRKGLKSSGRLAFVCWRTTEENSWMTRAMKAAAKHVEVPPPAAPDDPGPFFLADADRVRKILDGAGFTSVDLQRNDQIVPLDEDGLEADVASRFESGPLAKIMDDATEDERDLIRGSVREALAPYYEHGGPTQMFATWIVTAKAS